MSQTVQTQCCVVGGGPAGMMLGLLLARYPLLRRIPAQLLGVGVRPEHVRSPALVTARAP